MTRDEFFKHVGDLERPFEIQPAPHGVTSNKFTLSNWNGNHIIIKAEHTQSDLFLPFSLIDAIDPGILQLTKIVGIAGKSLA